MPYSKIRKEGRGMLEEALDALAAAGGSAVVQAAGTDAWAGLRAAVARWFGRNDAAREQAELERLEQTAGELAAADGGTIGLMLVRHEAAWRARFEALLDGLDDHERAHAADQLRGLLTEHVHGVAPSAGVGGTVVGGNVEMRADRGSVVGWSVGDVTMRNPQRPGTFQG